MSKMRILLIEEAQWASDKELRDSLKNSPQIDIISGGFEKAAELIGSWNVDCVVIDACRGLNRQVSTESEAREIRKMFKGNLIAISGIPYNRIPLKRACCQYDCSKGRLAELLIRLSQQFPKDQAKKNLPAVA